jgi:SAM-dependent methyltransferase
MIVNESSKSIARRLHTPGFVTHYFVGRGIYVGSGNDSLGRYGRLFPLIQSITDFDLPDGDAQDLAKHADASFDFLHSSHCLEHVREPVTALRNWCRVVRKFGHIIVLVPDEDMYEQGIWPSTFNNDHKHTFTICKQKSWSPVSINVTDLLHQVADLAEPVRIEQLHMTFQRGIGRVDQTKNPVSECAIEFVLRRK